MSGASTTKGLKNLHRAQSLEEHVAVVPGKNGAPAVRTTVRRRRADAMPLRAWARSLVQAKHPLSSVAHMWLLAKGLSGVGGQRR